MDGVGHECARNANRAVIVGDFKAGGGAETRSVIAVDLRRGVTVVDVADLLNPSAGFVGTQLQGALGLGARERLLADHQGFKWPARIVGQELVIESGKVGLGRLAEQGGRRCGLLVEIGEDRVERRSLCGIKAGLSGGPRRNRDAD